MWEGRLDLAGADGEDLAREERLREVRAREEHQIRHETLGALGPHFTYVSMSWKHLNLLAMSAFC